MNLKFGRIKSSTSKLEEEIELKKQEVEMLMKENAELRDTINNMTFSDNSEIFSIPVKSDRYFGNITVADARALLANLELPHKKINLGWEVLE